MISSNSSSELKFVKLIKEQSDVIIVGTGLAGLTTALSIAENNKHKVVLLSKVGVKKSNTQYAQGGIAGVIDDRDSFALHIRDTVQAGAGLCNKEMVEVLVKEGKERIMDLIKDNFPFDKKDNKINLGKVGGHSNKRVLHTGGNSIGAKLISFFADKLKNRDNIRIYDNNFVIELLTRDNKAYGVLAYDKKEKKYKVYIAPVIVLATGGCGNLYKNNSNPKTATGDGITLAYRAGAEVMDLEFMQYHPTVLATNNFLISEALRGEGAILRNDKNKRFMPGYHKLAELAPRDIVSRAIYNEIKKGNKGYVYLDITAIDTSILKERFPIIHNMCISEGVDISKSYIPVKPAAHYLMGGIKVDSKGESSIENLFACGEVAATGVHGANRLATNSLLEALVFAKRTAKEINIRSNKIKFNFKEEMNFSLKLIKIHSNNKIDARRQEIQNLMEDKVGILRDEKELKFALRKFEEMLKCSRYDSDSIEGFEVKNLLILAQLMTKAALIRKESRGAHFRKDYPEKKQTFQKHIVLKKVNHIIV
ncbi:L-aspartate oxidase [Halonatronum saccharophilum]|uniref:L-aspartate oxidase n=1 Tax=Halonatronum saccharophilum TaxID=150060 RepID=UPI0004B05DC4|nr:L-aspartate oxidase [Halonatronum saccharophilum]